MAMRSQEDYLNWDTYSQARISDLKVGNNAVKDPMMAQIDQVTFLKKVSMLGGALLVAYFGAGPLSLDARRNSGR